MLCWFLLYNSINQLYCPLPLEPPSHTPNYFKCDQITSKELKKVWE